MYEKTKTKTKNWIYLTSKIKMRKIFFMLRSTLMYNYLELFSLHNHIIYLSGISCYKISYFMCVFIPYDARIRDSEGRHTPHIYILYRENWDNEGKNSLYTACVYVCFLCVLFFLYFPRNPQRIFTYLLWNV